MMGQEEHLFDLRPPPAVGASIVSKSGGGDSLLPPCNFVQTSWTSHCCIRSSSRTGEGHRTQHRVRPSVGGARQAFSISRGVIIG